MSQGSNRVGTRIGYAWLALTAVGIAVFAVAPYLLNSLPALADRGQRIADNYADQSPVVYAVFYSHIVTSGIALALSPIQFSAALRRRFPRAHRILGRVLIGSIALGGITGLVMAFFNDAGLVGAVGFGALSVLWVVAAGRALMAIRRRDIASHRAWMMRTFALTYAAVMLRLWTLVLVLAGRGIGGLDAATALENAYELVPFLCWIPNLLVAEWMIRRRSLPSYRLSPAVAA